MDLNIVREKENKVLDRKEISFEIENAVKTPSRPELRKQIAALEGSKEELVSIGYVKQCFGEHRAVGKAFLYPDPETLKRIEPEYLAQRESREKKEKKKEKETKAEKEKEGKKEGPIEEEKKEKAEKEEGKGESEAKPGEKKPARTEEGKEPTEGKEGNA